ncbi:transmembrane protein 41b [Plakobranchus ocellatus]|uniref:Transmembrane protein 41b n=1 Tax=Plakobranchus ocellatus TaxID=259542 RepID=A0AAV3ZVZ9_9GAST|nr:transmembrane protein 41b [Plakobranchus ocellatus]
MADDEVNISEPRMSRMRKTRLTEANVKTDDSSSVQENVSDFTQLRDNDIAGGDLEMEFTQLKEKQESDTNSLNDSLKDASLSTSPAHISGSDDQAPGSTRRSLLILALVFLTALGALGLVYSSFPELDQEEKQYVKVPRDIEDAKNLGRLLHRYKDKYYIEVLMGYFVVFIFLQTFAIPGSIFLSIISGFLYPFYIALPLVCFCSALGATFCYLLSFLVGRKIVDKYIPQRAAEWKRHVDNHREHLFNYILFLRITPFLPNWFINITSPVIDVPVSTFFFGTLFGVAPPSFVFVQAGTTLHKLTSTSEAWSLANIGLLAVFAVVAILPVAFKGKLRSKLE